MPTISVSSRTTGKYGITRVFRETRNVGNKKPRRLVSRRRPRSDWHSKIRGVYVAVPSERCLKTHPDRSLERSTRRGDRIARFISLKQIGSRVDNEFQIKYIFLFKKSVIHIYIHIYFCLCLAFISLKGDKRDIFTILINKY